MSAEDRWWRVEPEEDWQRQSVEPGSGGGQAGSSGTWQARLGWVYFENRFAELNHLVVGDLELELELELGL